MLLNRLRAPPRQARKRVGRGSGSGLGKTSGFGHKGQKSRGRGKVPRYFEGGQMGLVYRIPKLGFSSRIGRKTAKLHLRELDGVKAGEVTLASLKKAGLVAKSCTRVRFYGEAKLKPGYKISSKIHLTEGAKKSLKSAKGVLFSEKTSAKPGKTVKAEKKIGPQTSVKSTRKASTAKKSIKSGSKKPPFLGQGFKGQSKSQASQVKVERKKPDL